MRAVSRLAALAVFSVLLGATSLRAESITIGWDPNVEPDLAGYIVEYGTADAPFATRIDVGLQTTWILINTNPATTYMFRVRAYNTSGLESDPSTAVSWTTAPVLLSGGCATPDPFAAMGGGTCYNGGWLAPGMSPPTITTPTPAPAPAPTGSSTGCATPDPFVAMGGGTCYNGGWLPPGMLPPTSTPPTPALTTPAPTAAPTVSSTGCATPDPFVAIGGGICYNGGWLPPGMSPPANSPAPPPQPPTTTAPWATPAPVTNSGGCATPDPFAAMGGGTCYNGGWLPPGMTVPGGGTAAAPAPPQPTSTPTPQTGCLTPNPFATMPGLIGACYNGGWIPVQAQTGTVRIVNGTWMIVGDNGTTYVPTTTPPASLQQSGLAVVFAGVPLGMQNGAMVMSLALISAR